MDGIIRGSAILEDLKFENFLFPVLDWLYHHRGGYRLWKMFSFIESRCPSCGWMQWIVARKRT